MEFNKNVILSRLEGIKPDLKHRFGLSEIALFGSYARGDETGDSDIDILVRFDEPSYRNICKTAYLLYDLFPGKKVQVVSKGGIKPQYFKRLEGDLIYA